MSAVLTMPGDMQLTVTPRSAHSAPSVCVIFTTAALLALYAICFCGCGTSRLAMLAVFMMRPRLRCSMYRPSACAPQVHVGSKVCESPGSKSRP